MNNLGIVKTSVETDNVPYLLQLIRDSGSIWVSGQCGNNAEVISEKHESRFVLPRTRQERMNRRTPAGT